MTFRYEILQHYYFLCEKCKIWCNIFFTSLASFIYFLIIKGFNRPVAPIQYIRPICTRFVYVKISFTKKICWRFFLGCQTWVVWWNVYLNAAIQASCWKWTLSFVHYIWAGYITENYHETAFLFGAFLFCSSDCIFLSEKRKLTEVQWLCAGEKNVEKKVGKVKYLNMLFLMMTMLLEVNRQ